MRRCRGYGQASACPGRTSTSNTWYDPSGRAIKVRPGGSAQFTKTRYDGLGRAVATYVGYDVGQTSCEEAAHLEGDSILEQAATTYDAAGNIIQTVHRPRYHDAVGPVELKDPGTEPRARVTDTAAWHDGAGRQIATAREGSVAPAARLPAMGGEDSGRFQLSRSGQILFGLVILAQRFISPGPVENGRQVLRIEAEHLGVVLHRPVEIADGQIALAPGEGLVSLLLELLGPLDLLLNLPLTLRRTGAALRGHGSLLRGPRRERGERSLRRWRGGAR